MAAALVETLRGELKQLTTWVASQGLVPPPTPKLGVSTPKKLPDIQAHGFSLCLELEQVKAWVREKGLIPPRFKATRSEAEDKAWDRGEVQPVLRSPRAPLAG